MRENVGVSLPPTPRAKFLTPQVLKRCKYNYKKEKLVIKQGYSYAKWPQSERSYILQNFAFFSRSVCQIFAEKVNESEKKRGCQFPCTVVVVWWLLFPPQEIRDSLILCSLAFFLSPKLTTLLPLIIWIPHHKKMWQTRVGEGWCCFWNVKKSIWIQIHLSKELKLEDKFQFFKLEVQKGNPTLTNETSWTNVRLVNYKDLAKGSAGDSLSDWWPIQCFDCSCCFREEQANL